MRMGLSPQPGVAALAAGQTTGFHSLSRSCLQQAAAADACEADVLDDAPAHSSQGAAQQLQQHAPRPCTSVPPSSPPNTAAGASSGPSTNQQHSSHHAPHTTRLPHAASLEPETSYEPCPEYEEALKKVDGPIEYYRKQRLAGLLRQDPRQEYTVALLQQLYDELADRYVKRRSGLPSGLTAVDALASSPPSPSSSGGGSWWSKITSLMGAGDSQQDDWDGAYGPDGRKKAIRGLYMYGGVGCGKTMLMDMMVDSAPPEFKLKRTHFHDFMLDVHARLRRHSSTKDPLTHVANDISRSVKVLCLDELFVTDVADAMILHRLFGRLWDGGLTLIATSNRRPDTLYEGGLQRNLFLPFIKRLQDQCVVHNMDSPTDYRRLAQHRGGLYFLSRGDAPQADAALDARFHELTNHKPVGPKRVSVAMGRSLDIPEAGGCICMFPFQDLCGRPLGAADYIALANAEHTVAVKGVPVFTPSTRAEAYRFVTLIDVMYEHRVRMLFSAEGLPFELFYNIVSQSAAREEAARGAAANEALVVDDNLAFAKDRTVSRLMEMQSREYLVHHAQLHAPELLLAIEEDMKQHPDPNASPSVATIGDPVEKPVAVVERGSF